MTALLIVDVQNDFLPGGALGVKNGDLILPVINRLITLPFDEIVATQDWHPRDHGSFAETHQKKAGQVINLEGLQQILWPTHCLQGTKGAELSDKLDLRKIKKLIQKGTDKTIDSYSAFFDNGHRKSTGLHEYLQSRGVKEIYVVGLATDYCVKFSALDALELGYQVSIILDACKPVNLSPEDEEKALQEMLQAGANIAYSHEIISE